jgi:hypothetical protein
MKLLPRFEPGYYWARDESLETPFIALLDGGSGALMAEEDDRQPEQLKLTIDGPTLEAFLDDYSFVSIIRGRGGRASRSTCIAKMFQISSQQRPNRHGARKTRWAVVRNTYPELRKPRSRPGWTGSRRMSTGR